MPGVVYRGVCLTCKDVGPSSVPLPDGGIQLLEDGARQPCNSIYLGETSFSAFHRGLKHMESVSRPQTNQSNAFAKHRLEYHQGNDTRMEIQVDVLKNFPRPMQRQVGEGVEI